MAWQLVAALLGVAVGCGGGAVRTPASLGAAVLVGTVAGPRLACAWGLARTQQQLPSTWNWEGSEGRQHSDPAGSIMRGVFREGDPP